MELTPLITATLGRGAKAVSGSPVAESGGTFASDLAKANLPTDEMTSRATSGQPPAPSDTLAGGQGRASLAVMRQALREGTQPEGKDAGLSEIVRRLALIETAGREAADGDGNTLAAPGAQTPLTAWQPGDIDPAPTDSLESVAAPEITPGALTVTEAEALTEANGELRLEAGDTLSPMIATQQALPGEVARDARFDSLPEGRQARGEALNARGLIQAAPPVSVEAPRLSPEAALAHARIVEPQGSTRFLSPRGESLLADTTGAGLQAAGTQGNGVAGGTATPTTMSAPLNSPAWPQQLGQQLMTLIQRGGEQRVELHLNPAELGPLSISLKMNEQGAQLQFLSAHAQVRGAVEQAIPQLRDALAEQGIQLGETSVGEQRQESGRDFAGSTPGSPRSEGADDAGEAPPASGISTTADSLLDGRVDLYA